MRITIDVRETEDGDFIAEVLELNCYRNGPSEFDAIKNVIDATQDIVDIYGKGSLVKQGSYVRSTQNILKKSY